MIISIMFYSLYIYAYLFAFHMIPTLKALTMSKFIHKEDNGILFLSCILIIMPVNGISKHALYGDVIMGAITSQITSLTIVYSTVYSDADQRRHQSSASLAFVWGIHRGLVNSPHKWPVTRKMFPFDDVIIL